MVRRADAASAGWDGDREMILRRVPDGVVCINPPQNAAAVNALYGLTALLAGNAVVVRAPRGVPLSCMYAMREIVAPVLEEAGAPARARSTPSAGRPCSTPGWPAST